MLSSSCNDFLDEDPKGKLTPGTFFSTQDELTMATYALYKNVCLTQTNTNPTIPSWLGDDVTANPGSNKQAYAEIDAFRGSDAVSYTHLDVYKRQHSQSWKPAIIAPSKKDREYFKILS